MTVLLNQSKFDVSFEIFLAFLGGRKAGSFVCVFLCCCCFPLFFGFLSLTQKTEGTNDLLTFFFMHLQRACSHLSLQCLSNQWTQRNTSGKHSVQKGHNDSEGGNLYHLSHSLARRLQVMVGISCEFPPCPMFYLLFLNK